MFRLTCRKNLKVNKSKKKKKKGIKKKKKKKTPPPKKKNPQTNQNKNVKILSLLQWVSWYGILFKKTELSTMFGFLFHQTFKGDSDYQKQQEQKENPCR